MIIRVVNKRTFKGLPSEYDLHLYIGRPTPLGNPFSHLPNTLAEFAVPTRCEAVEKYETWLRAQLKTNDTINSIFDDLVEAIVNMMNVTLICWCAPEQCHGDVIKKILEEMLEEYGKKQQEK